MQTDERGTVKRDGTVQDRRWVQPWVRVAVGGLLVVFCVFLAVAGVATVIALHNAGQADKAQNKASIAKKDASKTKTQAAVASTRAKHAVDKASAVDRKLARNERRDVKVARATAFRLCSRTNVTRAALHWQARHHSRYMRFLRSREGAPILNCAPNLGGMGAEFTSAAKQERFVRRWRAGKLTGLQLGVCPHVVFGEARKCHR